MRTALVIDDNPAVGIALELLFGVYGIRTLHAASPEEGLDLLAREPVDFVMQDMNFTRGTTSGEEGVALFHAMRAKYPDLPIILITAWTHRKTAVELIAAGAADYLGKPWDDDRLIATVENLLDLPGAARDRGHMPAYACADVDELDFDMLDSALRSARTIRSRPERTRDDQARC